MKSARVKSFDCNRTTLSPVFENYTHMRELKNRWKIRRKYARCSKTLGKCLGEGGREGVKNKRDELQNELPSNDGSRGRDSPTHSLHARPCCEH